MSHRALKVADGFCVVRRIPEAPTLTIWCLSSPIGSTSTLVKARIDALAPLLSFRSSPFGSVNRPNQLENESNQDEKQCRDIPEVSIDKPWRVLHPRREPEDFLIYPEPDSHHVAHRPQSKLPFDQRHKPLPFNRRKALTVFEFVPYREISLVFLALDGFENF